jgi:hypothetical protein
MFRNRIINGNFDIWQRGTTPGTMAASTVAGEYVSADMWKIVAYNAAVGYNYVSLTQLATGLPTGVLYAGKLASTAAATDAIIMGQYIESANSYSLVGQKVTISLKLKKLAGFDAGTSIAISLFRLNSKDVAATYLDGPASGGATLIQQFTHTLTTSDWESVTCTTTSVLPSEAANGLLLHLYYGKTDMGASEKFAVAQVQLEPGTVATPFEFRPYGTELALCQRYYYQTPTGTILGYMWPSSSAATGRAFYVKFPVSMRAAPTSPSFDAELGTESALAVTTEGFVAGTDASTSGGVYIRNVAASAEL